jgi:hypothetical protein
MSAPPASSATPEIVFLVLIIIILARRTVLQLQGSRFSVGRLFVFAGFYTLLFVALAFATLYAATVTWGTSGYGLIVPYIAVPALGGVFAAPYIRRIVRFERRDDGEWYYRLSWHIPVLYLALFTARIVAEVAVFGLAGVEFTIPPPAPPSTGALEILIGVDLLFGLSLGLLLGRGVGVFLAHRDLPASPTGPSSPPSPPLPSGPPP